MSKDALKQKFATGEKPTGADFATLIEQIYSRLTGQQVEEIIKPLQELISQKANDSDVENANEAIAEIIQSSEKFLTEEQLAVHIANKVNTEDVYTKEEFGDAVSEIISDLEEKVSELRDEIANIKGEDPEAPEEDDDDSDITDGDLENPEETEDTEEEDGSVEEDTEE